MLVLLFVWSIETPVVLHLNLHYQHVSVISLRAFVACAMLSHNIELKILYDTFNTR
jgi:hypothetical protein